VAFGSWTPSIRVSRASSEVPPFRSEFAFQKFAGGIELSRSVRSFGRRWTWEAGRQKSNASKSTRCGAARLHHALADQRAIETRPARHWADLVPLQPQTVPAVPRTCATVCDRWGEEFCIGTS
jgi:hypothetical protein